MKNTHSLNPSKEALKLELEEICMLSLLLILMSMEVEAIFLLEIKEKLLKKTSVEKHTGFKDIDSLNLKLTEELWQELASTFWCVIKDVLIQSICQGKALNG